MLATNYGNFGSILLGLLGVGISILLFVVGIIIRASRPFWFAGFVLLLNAAQLFASFDSAKDGDRELTLGLTWFSVAFALFCFFVAWRKKKPDILPAFDRSPPDDR